MSAPAESCRQPQNPMKGICPACKNEGKAVSAQTLDHWVLPDARSRLDDAQALICHTPDCLVVYFTPDGQRVGQHEVIARVGYKKGAGLTPVCYCFGHTREAIESELRVTGECRAAALITAEIKAGRCACETKNPDGQCCLGNVSLAIKSAREQLEGTTGSESGASPAICTDTVCAI